jgi:hypothetical protein
MKFLKSFFSLLLTSLFLIACQKDDIENKPPVVNAGKDTLITLNATTGNNVRLTGSATDADGSVVSYLWSQVSGPNKANIETSGSSSTLINGLISGVYVFQLMATDDKGAVGSKTVSITIVQNNQLPGSNKPPIVNAGNDTTYALKSSLNDTITLKGSAIDSDGVVVSYVWTQISGPTSAKILYQGSVSTKVTNITAGTYVFQLMAIDDKGATGTKTVSITLQAPPTVTLTLQPSNNPAEASVYSDVPNGTGVGTPQIVIGAWTVNGNPVYHRLYLMFDYSAIPAGSTVLSAKLSLYANPNPLAGNFIDANYGTANSFTIQRITSAWNPANVSWNNQPTTTSTNQIIIPNSTSSFQNSVDIDVTQLVKDMQQNSNNGFGMRLVTESYYNIRQYISSYNTDASKHPKLVIQYAN